MKAVDPFQDAGKSANTIEPGRGGFQRNGNGRPYIADPDGRLVGSGPRKGQPTRIPYWSTSSFAQVIDSPFDPPTWGPSTLPADRGTHIHTLTERFDRKQSYKDLIADGEELGITEEQQVAAVTAWAKMLADNGLEVVAIEQPVVDDGWRCAGTLDRVVRCTRDLRFVLDTGAMVIPAGTCVVLDLKTGGLRKTAAVQVASYAHSVPYDVVAESRGEWDL